MVRSWSLQIRMRVLRGCSGTSCFWFMCLWYIYKHICLASNTRQKSKVSFRRPPMPFARWLSRHITPITKCFRDETYLANNKRMMQYIWCSMCFWGNKNKFSGVASSINFCEVFPHHWGILSCLLEGRLVFLLLDKLMLEGKGVAASLSLKFEGCHFKQSIYKLTYTYHQKYHSKALQQSHASNS